MVITRMDSATQADWDQVLRASGAEAPEVPAAMLDMLRRLEPLDVGFAVDQLVHSLQTATRAERAGADDELVVAALFHDVGKVIDVVNHAGIAAELLRPYVRPEISAVLRAHQDFEGAFYYGFVGLDPEVQREHVDQPWYDLAVRFSSEWDQCSFEPDYDTLPLEHFEARVWSVLRSPRC